MSNQSTILLLSPNEIKVTDRVRKADSPEVKDHIESLRVSLRRFGGHPNGLLQPILVDDANVLQAGWCRYSAATAEGWPTIPCYRRSALTDDEYREVELEENFRRLGFTWQEEVTAVVDIHKTHLRRALREGRQWTQQMTGDLLGGYSDSYVSNCLRIAPKLSLPPYAKCESITDAVRLWYREREDIGVAELAKRTSLNPSLTPKFEFKIEVLDNTCKACGGTGFNSRGGLCASCVDKKRIKVLETTLTSVTPPPQSTAIADGLASLLASPDEPTQEATIDLSNSLFLGDSVRTVLSTWPDSCVDHIISDPPYGIDVENLQQATSALMDCSRIVDTHDVSENLELFQLMMPVFYRILKDGGFMILWCDVMNWQLLYDQAMSVGFKVQRWPLVWCKTSPCKCQMAHVLFTKDYELAIVCRKGNARLPQPVTTSRILCPNDAERASNPFAKPFRAWEFLISSVSIQGQTILEPFAGEGSGVLAGLKLGRRVLAIEKDEAHFNYMLEAVKQHWMGVFKKVMFV